MAKKVYRDGRVKLTGKDYTDHKREVWEAQQRMCSSCGLYVSLQNSQFDHDNGRGMAGSKRDDLDPDNTVKHPWCHGVRHFRQRDLAAKVKP